MNPALLLIAATLGAVSAYGDAFIGDWRGDSVCVVRPSACADENALYHVKRLTDRPDHFSVTADKIVNGGAVNMGTIDCAYMPEKQSLKCEWPKGVLQLALHGPILEGTMHLPDGTLWRKISLKRSSAPDSVSH